MNLKNIKDAPGTGTDTDTSSSSSSDNTSPDVVYNYVMTILIILAAILLFCYMTTTNYLNALAFKPEDYPIGNALDAILAKNVADNPYCSRVVSCEMHNVEKISLKILAKLWLQTTQSSCYQAGGYVLNKYFSGLQWGIGGILPYDHIFSISFVRWFIFGIITIVSMILMLAVVWVIFLAGWFGGLLLFMVPKENDVRKLLGFCTTFCLTMFCGWISIFPVIYGFFYLIYLFLFKQLIKDPIAFSADFTRRMSDFIVLFVIGAIIVAGMQLPPATAAAAGGVVILVGALVHHATKKSN